ncbi:MAG: hypothetical protein K9L30_17720 [Desulfobacterales bacterium]|nr:hypothetical protein [Desulfobacterales bacterium]
MSKGLIKTCIDIASRDKETSEYLKSEYLKELRENLHRTDLLFSKRTTTVFILIAAYILVHVRGVEEVNLNFIKIKNLSILQSFLPIIIAYMFSNMCSLIALRKFLRTTHDYLFTKCHTKAAESNLGINLLPPSSFITEEYIWSSQSKRYQAFSGIIVFPLFQFIIFLPMLFLMAVIGQDFKGNIFMNIAILYFVVRGFYYIVCAPHFAGANK